MEIDKAHLFLLLLQGISLCTLYIERHVMLQWFLDPNKPNAPLYGRILASFTPIMALLVV